MEERITKKEIIASILLILLILLFAFIIIFVHTNKNAVEVKEEPTQLTKDTYVNVENIENEELQNLYSDINIKKLKFKNIDSSLINILEEKQDYIITSIENNLEENIEYIKNYNTTNNITDYQNKSTLDSIILYNVKDNILSILFLVEDNVDYKELNNYITNVFIDVKENKQLDTKTILEKYNLTQEQIVKEVIENIITNKEILHEQEKYEKELIENFDKYLYLYFNDNNIYLKYNKNDISKLLFNEELTTIKYSTLKIN